MSAVTKSNEESIKNTAAIIAAKLGPEYGVQVIGEKEIEARLAEVAIETMKEFAKNKSTLSQGVFSNVEYFEALKKKGKPAKVRLEKMVEQNLFFHGLAPSEYFHFVPDESMPTKNLPEYYQLDSGKSATDGLKALRKGPTLLGSEGTCQIAYYIAVQTILGKDKFDALFGLQAKWPLMIGWGRKLPKGLFNPFCSIMDVPSINDIKDIKKGHIIGVEGAKIYPRKHIVGNGKNCTVMCVEEGNNPKFRGLSLNDVTTQQVAQFLLDSFNADAVDPHEILTKELCSKICDANEVVFKQAPLLKKFKITMETFQSQGGGKFALNSTMTFHVNRIATLAKLSIPEACKKLEEWQKIDVIAFSGESK